MGRGAQGVLVTRDMHSYTARYMKTPCLYIETSVFGFCFDEEPHNRNKREATTVLFEQIRQGLLRGCVSELVLRELQETGDPELREQLHELTTELDELPIRMESDVEVLSRLYMDRGAIPPGKIDDAVHVAIVVTNPEVDVLVSWNCRHIVNTNVKKKVRALTEEAGYTFDFEVATPEEVILYEV